MVIYARISIIEATNFSINSCKELLSAQMLEEIIGSSTAERARGGRGSERVGREGLWPEGGVLQLPKGPKLHLFMSTFMCWSTQHPN